MPLPRIGPWTCLGIWCDMWKVVLIIIVWIILAVIVCRIEDAEASQPIALIDGQEHGEWIKANYDALKVSYNYYNLDGYRNLEQLLAQARANRERVIVVEAILINDLWLNEVKILHDAGAIVYLPSGWQHIRISPGYAPYAVIVGGLDFYGKPVSYLNNENVEMWVYSCGWAWKCSTSEAVARAPLEVD